MKRKLMIWGFAIVMLLGLSMTTYAADGNVTFTSDSNLTYGSDLGNKFEGMAPGQTKEVSIEIKNDNTQTADFYVNTAGIKALEDADKAAGGAYNINLKVSQPGATDVTLYSSDLGGASGTRDSATKKTTGIDEMKSLEGETYLVTLKNGETANLVLTFTMDGESIRSDSISDYSNKAGNLGFQFAVAYDKVGNRVIVNREDLVEYQTGSKKQNIVTTVKNVVVAVKTGDDTAIIPIVAIMAAGLLLLAVTGKKKKRNEEVL